MPSTTGQIGVTQRASGSSLLVDTVRLTKSLASLRACSSVWRRPMTSISLSGDACWAWAGTGPTPAETMMAKNSEILADLADMHYPHEIMWHDIAAGPICMPSQFDQGTQISGQRRHRIGESGARRMSR